MRKTALGCLEQKIALSLHLRKRLLESKTWTNLMTIQSFPQSRYTRPQIPYTNCFQRLTLWSYYRNMHDEVQQIYGFRPQFLQSKISCASKTISSTLLYTFFNTDLFPQSKMYCGTSSFSITFLYKNCSKSWPSSGATIAACGGFWPSKHNE